jgi:hypothetical protein
MGMFWPATFGATDGGFEVYKVRDNGKQCQGQFYHDQPPHRFENPYENAY